MKLPLDHIGFVGADTERLAATFHALGFQVTGPAVLSGPGVQRSAHIMFPDTYIELTSVDPCPPDHHLALFNGQDEAIRLLVLGTEDAEQRAAQLARAGVDLSGISEASRILTYGSHETARFKWFSLAGNPIPHTLTAFVEHQSRDAVFCPQVSQHPNTVMRIAALHHQPGNIPEILCDDSAKQVGLVETPSKEAGAFFVGMDLLATRLESCEQVLRENKVPFEYEQNSLRIPATHAAGAFLRIRECK